MSTRGGIETILGVQVQPIKATGSRRYVTEIPGYGAQRRDRRVVGMGGGGLSGYGCDCCEGLGVVGLGKGCRV